jgi:hypothetical protein
MITLFVMLRSSIALTTVEKCCRLETRLSQEQVVVPNAQRLPTNSKAILHRLDQARSAFRFKRRRSGKSGSA